MVLALLQITHSLGGYCKTRIHCLKTNSARHCLLVDTFEKANSELHSVGIPSMNHGNL